MCGDREAVARLHPYAVSSPPGCSNERHARGHGDAARRPGGIEF